LSQKFEKIKSMKKEIQTNNVLLSGAESQTITLNPDIAPSEERYDTDDDSLDEMYAIEDTELDDFSRGGK